jgi:Zn-dependent protease
MDFVTIGTIVAVIFSITSHEAAHAWVADRLGDPTARQLGRVTLNPLPHIDPFMTILLPALLYMSGGVMFGGARPVPVDVRRLRRPARDWALVALAGPGMNLLLGLGFSLLLSALIHTGVFQAADLGVEVLMNAVFVNVLLAVFNMVPVPPLDGSRVVMYGLHRLGARQVLERYVQLERFGILILIGLLFLVPGFWGLLHRVMDPVFHGLLTLVGLT